MIVTVRTPEGAEDGLRFPPRCVSCGAPRTVDSALALAKVVTNPRTGTQRATKRTFQIPHCDACARTTKTVFLAGLIPFALGFLIAGGVAFAVVGFKAFQMGADDVGRLNNNNSLVLGAAAGLFAGIAGGFVAELLARVLLLPLFGRALLRAPLLVPSLFSDSDYVAGLAIRANADFSECTLHFTDDEAGRAFVAANQASAS